MEIVWRALPRRVEVLERIISTTHQVIIANDDAGDGRQEDAVGRQVRCEVIGSAQEIPGTHAQPNYRAAKLLELKTVLE
jgi:hypothetical protein